MARRPRPHRLTQVIQAALAAQVRPGEGVLLAVSGGADSTALLEASAPLARGGGLRLEVATVDHGLREGSPADAAAVVAHAARWGLPAHVRALQMPHGPAVEARARALREAALEAVRAERGLAWIATAHTADDQAETVLMRLLRGAGGQGAVGILPRKGCVLRPLLSESRAGLRRFLQARGVPWREDPMNADLGFFRPRVRHQLLPALRAAAGFDPVHHLAGFAARALRDHEALSALAQDAERRLSLGNRGLDAAGVRALLPAVRIRVLASVLRARGVPITEPLLLAAEAAVLRGGHCDLARTHTLSTEGGTLRVVPRRRSGPSADGFTLAAGAEAFDPASGLALRVLPTAPVEAWSLPVPESALPLTVRRRRRGERLRYGGRTRSLQDVLVDARVPAELRDRLPVIVSAQGEPMAVAGVWPARTAAQEKWQLVATPQRNPSDRAGAGL